MLVVIDELEIDENGVIKGWACALKEMSLSDEPLQKCPAPNGDCPRGFTKTFECESIRS